jgi:hypothetical protein
MACCGPSESGASRAHSKTLREFRGPATTLRVLECGTEYRFSFAHLNQTRNEVGTTNVSPQPEFAFHLDGEGFNSIDGSG